MNRLSKIIAAVSFSAILLCGCTDTKPDSFPAQPILLPEAAFTKRLENTYAEQFTIDRYEHGYSIIHTMDGESFCIVPEHAAVPEIDGLTVLQQPLDDIYLTATSAMCLADALDCITHIRFSGTKPEDWAIPAAVEAMKQEEMLYAGKYREPDYELLLKEGCDLSVQSSMIFHAPEVREQLSALGIPVFIDYSSYETHPLGRSEWIKVYGEIFGKSDAADQLFSAQASIPQSLTKPKKETTAAFFYINAAGQAVTRKSGDYVTQMITIAGGTNIFSNLGDSENASSSVTLEMEEFYTKAKDADFIIYNSTIAGEVNSISELIAKNPLLADFKAVQNGNVWCTTENLFQETMQLGTVISDFNRIFTGQTASSPPEFLFRLD